MDKTSGLREVDAGYLTHAQMWEEIDACNQGYKQVLKLVSSQPAPVYADTCNGMRFDHLDEDLQKAAYNQIYNADLASAKRLKEYWNRGRFFNATGRTVESFHGMIWSNPSESELSPKMEVIAEDVNGSGLSLDKLAQKITYQLILNGRYGVLSDMPSTDTSLTMAQQESGAFSPKMISYDACNVKMIAVVNGQMVDIRLTEHHTVKSGDYGYECKEYIRQLVLKDGVYENLLYNDKDELIEMSIPRANGKPLNFIPFVIYGSDSNTPEYSKPPMFDIAHINLGHFRLDCDNRDNLYYHGQGMTNVFTDMDKQQFDSMNPAGLDTGARGVNMLQSGDKVELLQLEATGAIPSEMLRDEDRMIKAGAQIVNPSNSTMTLGQKKIETGSSLSTLARISHNTSEGLNLNLEYCAMFAGDTQESTYKVNSKFITDDMTPEMLNAQMAMVQGGVLPSETLNESARRAGLTKLDDEQIKQKLLEDGESLTGDSEEVAQLKAEIEGLKAGQE